LVVIAAAALFPRVSRSSSTTSTTSAVAAVNVVTASAVQPLDSAPVDEPVVVIARETDTVHASVAQR
jgi:hypothetical protein